MRVSTTLTKIGAVLLGIAAFGSCANAHDRRGDHDYPKPSKNDVPLPKLSKPIPITKTSHPWNGAAWQYVPINLKKYGYVEEEYLVSGKSNVYGWKPNGNFKVDILRSANYTTRLDIRRPANMKKFSGRVIVEIINMSAGYDWTAVWGAVWERVLDNGDIYVGITSKPNVFDGMIRFDASRYSKLSMPNPLPPEQQICGRLPGETGYNPNLSKLYENGLAYDIFSQVGALLKTKDKRNPIGQPAKTVILAGESQSVGYLMTYFKFLHPIAAYYGKPIFDGYFAEAGGPAGAVINQCATALAADDPQRQVPPRSVPLVFINSQLDYWSSKGPITKPDSNTKTDKTTAWEVAGTNHGWEFQYDYSDAAAADLIKIGFADPATYAWSCPAERPEIQVYMPEKALYEHLIKWIEKGKAPPSAPLLEMVPGTSTLAFDADNNAKGGLRMPQMRVPTAGYGIGRGSLSGDCPTIVGFSPEKLKQLYPTHAAYVNAYGKAVKDLIKKGYLLDEDGHTLFKQALKAKIPN